MTGTPQVGIERDMGYSLDEFARAFPAAMRDFRLHAEPAGWLVATLDDEPVARVRASARPTRRIGALALPVLRVAVEFVTDDPQQAAHFRHRFDTGLHRGGG